MYLKDLDSAGWAGHFPWLLSIAFDVAAIRDQLGFFINVDAPHVQRRRCETITGGVEITAG